MLPFILKRWSRFGNYLALFEGTLGKPATQHFRHFLVAFILYLGSKNVTGLNRATFNPCHLSSFDRFLPEGTWKVEEFDRIRQDYLNRHIRRFLAKYTAKNQRVPAFLCIDDTNNPKAGTKAEGVAFQYSHLAGRNIWCWCLVTAVMVIGDYVVPFDFQLYRREKDCIAKGQSQIYHSKVELAVQLIASWQPPQGTQPFVLVDNWYMSEDLLAICAKRNFTLIGGIKPNRTIKLLTEPTATSAKQSLKEYGPTLPASAYRLVTIGKQRWLMASSEVELKGGFAVKLVVSKSLKANSSLNYWVCSDRTLSVARIMELYGVRWEIETFHKQIKQLLGLSDNQCVSWQAVRRMWTLVLIAYSYLMIERVEYSQEYKKGHSRMATLGEVVREHQKQGHQALVEWVYAEAVKGAALGELLAQIGA